MSEKTSSSPSIGRLGRKAYWRLAAIPAALALVGLGLLACTIAAESMLCSLWAATLLCVVVPVFNALMVKKSIARLHDVGATAFFAWAAAAAGVMLALVALVSSLVGFACPTALLWVDQLVFPSIVAAWLAIAVQWGLCLISRVPGTNDYGPAAGCGDKPFAGTCWGGIAEDMLKLMLVMGFLGYLCKLLQEPFTTPTPTDSLISLIHKGGVKDATFADTLESQVNAGGGDLAEVDDQGRTILMLAISTGIDNPAQGSAKDLNRLYYLRRLMGAKGVDANAKDKAGKTALHHAAEYGMTYCCMALAQEAGLDVTAKTAEGKTPAELAAANGHVATARALLQLALLQKPKEANPLLKLIAADNVSDTPFDKEMQEGTAAFAKNGKVFVNEGDNTARTPLMMTVYANFNNPREAEAKDLDRLYYLRKLLTTEGTDMTARDKDGFTALHWASWSGMPYCSLVLVNDGKADINAADNNGFTPLMLAAMRGNVSVARMLLQLGADASLKNKAGETALQLAESAAAAYSHRDSFFYTLVYSQERMDDYKATVELLKNPDSVLSLEELDKRISDFAKPADTPAAAE